MKHISTIRIASFLIASIALGQLTARGDVSGTWTWSSKGFWGQPMEASLALKEDGGALSGSYEGDFGKSELEDGKVDGSAISFQFTRKFGDREITSKFAGKLDGELLKGTLTLEGMDEPRSAEWQAYRTPEIDPSGLWKWQTTSGRDGSKRDSWVKLVYTDGELTGSYRTSRGQSPISEAALAGKELSFKVERRWGDRSFATSYKGTLSIEGIAGKITSRRNDEDRVVDWAASREIPKADPLGSWTWNTRGRNGEDRENKFTIVKDGDELKGTFVGREDESPIEDAKLDGDVLSFSVSSETDRGTFSSSFNGKIDEDVFRGKVTMKFGEREFKRSVAANRALPAPKPEGSWTWTSRRGRDGDGVENKLELSNADGKLVGSFSSGDETTSLTDVVLEGNQISFKLQRTFRDNPVTLRYSGQVRGDSIKGSYRWGSAEGEPVAGGWKSFWNAERAAK